MSTQPKALDIGRYLLQLANSEEEPELLTPMRLQKLLYYVQGWQLAETGAPMFSDRIEAWTHGPVMPEVFQEFKKYGGGMIPAEEAAGKNLDDAQQDFVRAVWNAYKPFSAFALSQMTHDEAPWRLARGAIPREAACSAEITHKAMREYFSSQANGKAS